MKSKLDYISGRSIVPEQAIGISPSQFIKFFDKPHEWYRSEVLGEQQVFSSTAMVIGTLVHYCAESAAKGLPIEKPEIWKYVFTETCPPKAEEDFIKALKTNDEEAIEQFICSNYTSENIDPNVVFEQYKPMGNQLISFLRSHVTPNHVEELIKAEIIPGYYIAGSCDAFLASDGSGKVIDYKTTSKLTADSRIPYSYKLQLLSYAYIYNKLGYTVDRISIIWITRNSVNRTSPTTGKPMKDYPSTVTETVESITQDDLDFIESLLTLCSETLSKAKEDPSLVHLLFKDMRLKVTQ